MWITSAGRPAPRPGAQKPGTIAEMVHRVEAHVAIAHSSFPTKRLHSEKGAHILKLLRVVSTRALMRGLALAASGQGLVLVQPDLMQPVREVADKTETHEAAALNEVPTSCKGAPPAFP